MNSGDFSHALESLAVEAAAERGQLEDAVASEREDNDDAEQDLGEFLHPDQPSIVRAITVRLPSNSWQSEGAINGLARSKAEIARLEQHIERQQALREERRIAIARLK